LDLAQAESSCPCRAGGGSRRSRWTVAPGGCPYLASRLRLPLRRHLLRLRPSAVASSASPPWSSRRAAQLRRPVLRALLLFLSVPSHGGGAGRRLRGGETAGLARSGGLKLGPWRRQPDLVASTSGYSVGRALLELRRGQAVRWSSGRFGAPSTSPSGPTAMAGARARTWRGADPRQAARRSGGGRSSRRGGGAGAGAAGGAD